MKKNEVIDAYNSDALNFKINELGYLNHQLKLRRWFWVAFADVPETNDDYVNSLKGYHIKTMEAVYSVGAPDKIKAELPFLRAIGKVLDELD